MEQIFNFIDDHKNNQFIMNDFHEVLRESNMYIPSNETILNKLHNHYQDDVIIVNKIGAPIYFCLKNKGYDILRKSHQESKEDPEHYQLIDRVVKVLFDDIKEYTTDDFTEYLASDTMFTEARNIPKKLKYFLEKLILNRYRKEKNSVHYEPSIISIAHAIMSAMFPLLIHSSLQIAVGIALHRKFGSKELVDMCHTMGFSCSYNEVRTYETSAVMQAEIQVKDDTFVQFVCDNADWNLETLDGKGTFHSLGSCEIITPASDVLPRKPFPRLKSVSEEEIATQGKIKIKNYELTPMEGIKSYDFPEPNVNLKLKFTYASKINSYWMFLKYVNPTFEKGWNGFIEDCTAINTHFEVSAINFLPFIHAYPSDYSTLYTFSTFFKTTRILLCMQNNSKTSI
uniref:Uncharacterized protein n=1 Tax=Trichogramma kaykai TaxID=54128 RepID=A0ABD2WYE4_9HYME